MKTTNKIPVLGVGISQTSFKNALETVEKRLRDHHTTKTYFIATPNPEMLVLASYNKQFKQILNRADLAIPDGIGLIWASKFLRLTKILGKGDFLTERIAGTDLMLKLCNLAAKKGYTVGLLGGRDGIAEKTAEVLRKQFPGIKINFIASDLSSIAGPAGARLARSYSPKAKTRTRLAPSPALAPGVDLLFVALGAPKQEEFIHKVKSQKSKVKINCKVAMGVGGAFDLINGRLKRAPRIWQELGIEWLWRLIQEPRRIQRIITATIIFPLLIFKSAILSLWQNKNH